MQWEHVHGERHVHRSDREVLAHLRVYGVGITAIWISHHPSHVQRTVLSRQYMYLVMSWLDTRTTTNETHVHDARCSSFTAANVIHRDMAADKE